MKCDGNEINTKSSILFSFTLSLSQRKVGKQSMKSNYTRETFKQFTDQWSWVFHQVRPQSRVLWRKLGRLKVVGREERPVFHDELTVSLE